MELRRIRYFLTLAEELNFSRAADKLHIAQPHLSRQIQELEKEIGAQLFYRTKRQVELTDAGKTFLKKAYEIFELIEEASISARLSSTGTEGEFKIGFTGTVQDVIPTIQHYRQLFPNIRIILKLMSSNKQIVALNEKKIDIALISIPIYNKNVHVKPLKNMPFVVALPENHHLANKPSVSIQELANEPFIMTPKIAGTMYYDIVMQAFQKYDLSPNLSIQAYDLQTVLLLVAAGLGVTVTPSPINAFNGIVYRKLEDIDLKVVGSIAWRKDNKSEILNNFLSFLFDHFPDKFEDIEETDPIK